MVNIVQSVKNAFSRAGDINSKVAQVARFGGKAIIAPKQRKDVVSLVTPLSLGGGAISGAGRAISAGKTWITRSFKNPLAGRSLYQYGKLAAKGFGGGLIMLQGGKLGYSAISGERYNPIPSGRQIKSVAGFALNPPSFLVGGALGGVKLGEKTGVNVFDVIKNKLRKEEDLFKSTLENITPSALDFVNNIPQVPQPNINIEVPESPNIQFPQMSMPSGSYSPSMSFSAGGGGIPPELLLLLAGALGGGYLLGRKKRKKKKYKKKK